MKEIVIVTGYTSEQLQRMASEQGISVDTLVAQFPPDCVQRFTPPCDHVWVPHPKNRQYYCVFCSAWQTV